MNLPLWFSAMLVGITLQANAETITLEKSPCGTVRNCANVPNSAGVDIDILASTAYSNAGIYIDGNGPYVGPNPRNGPLDGVFYTVSGEWVQLSQVTFSSTSRLVGVGRGQHWVTNWVLESGTVTRP
jgi:hypothetical protein